MAKEKKSKKAKKDDTVKVSYTGKLKDGTVFDTSDEDAAKDADIHDPERKYEPMEVDLSSDDVIPGFKKGIVGMEEGETKEIDIDSEKAYGPPQDELIMEVPRDAIEGQGMEPEEGAAVQASNGAVGRIVEVGKETVKVDFNHPLAGKDLKFTITLEEIE